LRSSTNTCTLRATPCRPGCAHRIFIVGEGCSSLGLCWRCGAYSRRAARLLLRPCRDKQPDKSHGAESLAAIAACKCPATGAELGARPLQRFSAFQPFRRRSVPWIRIVRPRQASLARQVSLLTIFLPGLRCVNVEINLCMLIRNKPN